MNRGMDIKAAFEKAIADTELRHEQFMGAVFLDVASRECTAISARPPSI